MVVDATDNSHAQVRVLPSHVKWSSTCRETAISSPSKILQMGHFAVAVAKVAAAVSG